MLLGWVKIVAGWSCSSLTTISSFVIVIDMIIIIVIIVSMMRINLEGGWNLRQGSPRRQAASSRPLSSCSPSDHHCHCHIIVIIAEKQKTLRVPICRLSSIKVLWPHLSYIFWKHSLLLYGRENLYDLKASASNYWILQGDHSWSLHTVWPEKFVAMYRLYLAWPESLWSCIGWT